MDTHNPEKMMTVNAFVNTPLPRAFQARPATLADVEAAVDLMNACTIKVIGESDETVENVRSNWQLPGFRLDTDVILVFSDTGALAGLAEVEDARSPMTPFLEVYVHPDYEQSGIGGFLGEWGEARARQAIERVPAEARVAMHAATYEQDTWYRGLLESFGMAPMRHFWSMRIDMDAPPESVTWPEGITLRTHAAGDDARPVLHARRDIWRDHWGYTEQPFDEEFPRWWHQWQEGYDPSLWFLAMDGETIAGICLCKYREFDEGLIGWVQTLGVRREYRKRGLGLALLRHAFGVFYGRGSRSVGLGVDASSLTGATRLYFNAGMYVKQRFDVYEKELRSGIDMVTHELED
ncbi:MAG: GNAT family N-acetyltransferase [Anaerolineae bacterium]|nr:GNAT family N-acetyltransferase [Anaerolineae bacterium]